MMSKLSRPVVSKLGTYSCAEEPGPPGLMNRTPWRSGADAGFIRIARVMACPSGSDQSRGARKVTQRNSSHWVHRSFWSR